MAKLEVQHTYKEAVNPKPPNLDQQFAAAARSSFAALSGEIAQRNGTIQQNDQYIYGELLESMLDIPVGHDRTRINWLRRTVEIHRAQFIGKGFSVDSTYVAEDVSAAGADNQNAIGDPNLAKQAQAEKTRLQIENQKKKAFAESRRQLVNAIIRDNGGMALWASAAENASAVGDTIIKAWYDQDEKKYHLEEVELVDNFYVRWKRDNFREVDAVAFVYQISKQEAISRYNVDKDVQTSPMGSPLVALSSANAEMYINSEEAVTIMEVTGKIDGWGSDGNGHLREVDYGKENEINVILVGDTVYQLIDKEEQVPSYYILPNKRARRRPWGIPDITKAAIDINLTYVETLSDWRTVANKVNFPKFKAYGFPIGVQPPKPKPRTVELLPLAQGQDIQPLSMGQSAALGESDFSRQMEELRNEFVREVGISRQLFDLPDQLSDSNQVQLTAMKSISDITTTKRSLWEPILRRIFEDALRTLAKFDKNIHDVVEGDPDWFIKISWPSALNADDPSYHAMNLNQFNTNLMSVQTFMERVGLDKQEIDRIREEMEDPVLAAMHGHLLNELAQYKIIPYGTPPPPKVNINLRGDMSPEQQGNLASSYPQIANGPFPLTTGPQGNAGLTATDNVYNQGDIAGGNPTGGMAVNHTAPGQQGQGAPDNGGAPQSPNMIQPPGANSPGVGIMSQPGTGAPAASPQGQVKKTNQHRGK